MESFPYLRFVDRGLLLMFDELSKNLRLLSVYIKDKMAEKWSDYVG